MSKKDKLILKMLQTFDDLGNDGMARIDARLWFRHYTKAAKGMGIIKKETKRGKTQRP